MANEAQIANWDGVGGEQWAREPEHYDAMLAPFTERILATADPGAGESAIDIGCGCGALALAVAERVGESGRVLGVDVSAPMLAVARERADAAGHTNVTFIRADAQVHAFDSGGADVVVSRFGVMFFDDPAAAFTNIARGVSDGGRLAFACWQEMPKCEWIIVPAMAILEHVPMPEMGAPGAPGPFAFGDPGRVEAILTAAGFTDVSLDEATVPLRVGNRVDDAIAFLQRTDLATTLLENADEATTERVWQSVRSALEPYDTSEGVVMNGAGWIVSARRAG